MPFKKGESGNPNGRPSNGRSIAVRIRQEFEKTHPDADGKKRKGTIILGGLLAEAILTGEVRLTSKKKLELAPREWFELTKFVAVHIDGHAPQAVELTGQDGGPIESKDVTLTDDDRAARIIALLDKARARRVGQADSGGESQ